MAGHQDTTEILSVCGQLERVAAEVMIDRGKAAKIHRKDFPRGAPTEDAIGQPAAFAIIVLKGWREEADGCLEQYHDVLREAEALPRGVVPLLEGVWHLAQREEFCRQEAEKAEARPFRFFRRRRGGR